MRYATARFTFRIILGAGLLALGLLPKHHPARVCVAGRIRENLAVAVPAMIRPQKELL